VLIDYDRPIEVVRQILAMHFRDHQINVLAEQKVLSAMAVFVE
jgi:hypothetical protein